MSTPTGAQMSDYDIRKEGWKALVERLGVSGAMRFLTQYDPGDGDYTKARHALFQDLTLERALQEIEQRSSGRPPRE